MGKRLTSRYTLVVHEVSTTTAKIWVGALLPSLAKPHNWRLVVKKINSDEDRNNETGETVHTIERLKKFGDAWKRPFNRLNKRFYRVEQISELEPGQDYIVEFVARVNHKWKLLEKSFFTTLPIRLPTKQKAPFTVGIGSCFYTKHDGGRAGQAYEALYRDQALKPNIKFLTGDQDLYRYRARSLSIKCRRLSGPYRRRLCRKLGIITQYAAPRRDLDVSG